ncbi:uncharacterized protein C1orf198 homolog isoform X2 [Photinus pyralis]|uniref:DUF4706 domain-containing protein n=1 Tax=Photinus pyralis TaxID=7054 RepID=A0A1Y1MW45_PHOPY|nr:uncharacterized protein C1orf198 homolog isoform X2 [Photinus pyralis]XP_031343218.1 uncharacterized protein C1orf198 homolog isoform X2 [Photinus pyralis]
MSLQHEAEQYFTAYDKLWSTLTENEQNQILTESIMKPEVCLKYSVLNRNGEIKNSYALKMISDDNFSYRDEHSAPFSFRTPSQRDLRLCEGSSETENVVSKPKILAQISTKSVTCDTSSSSLSSSSFNLPKTGLDLLDNW